MALTALEIKDKRFYVKFRGYDAKEVEEFDRSELDLEAYARWAEDLLEGWKISADFDELGMKKVDDAVKEESKTVQKTSRKGLAIEMIEDLYNQMIASIA